MEPIDVCAVGTERPDIQDINDYMQQFWRKQIRYDTIFGLIKSFAASIADNAACRCALASST